MKRGFHCSALPFGAGMGHLFQHECQDGACWFSKDVGIGVPLRPSLFCWGCAMLCSGSQAELKAELRDLIYCQSGTRLRKGQCYELHSCCCCCHKLTHLWSVHGSGNCFNAECCCSSLLTNFPLLITRLLLDLKSQPMLEAHLPTPLPH